MKFQLLVVGGMLVKLVAGGVAMKITEEDLVEARLFESQVGVDGWNKMVTGWQRRPMVLVSVCGSCACEKWRLRGMKNSDTGRCS